MITIIDRPCGFGKSTSLIKEVSGNASQPYLIIVPRLTEVKRFIDEIPHAYSPDEDSGISSTKMGSLIDLLQNKCTVVTTHAQFKFIKKFDYLLSDYVVVIDEVPEPVEQLETYFNSGEWKRYILDKGLVEVHPETSELSVTEAWYEERKFYTQEDFKMKGTVAHFMYTVETEDVYHVTDTYFAVHMPLESFTKPKHVKILTFMFEGTKLEMFFKKLNLSYHIEKVQSEHDEFKAKTKELLTLVKPQRGKEINCSYNKMTQRSAAERDKAKTYLGSLRTKYITRQSDFTTDDVLVVCAKDAWDKTGNVRSAIHASSGMSSSTWLPSITRGTNDFADRTVMIYLHQENMNVQLANHLGMNNAESKYHHAISEFLQVLYRTAIRRGKPVTLFLPDKKMLGYLERWLS